MINARAETAHDKPAFRAPFRHYRCLIQASGFYEWRATGHGKQPWYIRPTNGQLLLFAGLWDRWNGPDGHVDSCTILTTGANALMAPLHDRMPAILDTEGRSPGRRGAPARGRAAAGHNRPTPPVTQTYRW